MNRQDGLIRSATLLAFAVATLATGHDASAQSSTTPPNNPPTVRITSPANGAIFEAPARIQIFAEPRDIDGLVNTVEFFEGTNSLGIATNNPFAMSIINPFHVFWTDVPAGNYVLRAKATDDKGAIGWSDGVRISVVESNTPTVVTVTATDSDAEEIPVVPPGMGMPQRVNYAVFAVSRTGKTNEALTVYFRLSGTASNGVDYEKVEDRVTIPAGATSADVTIFPIDDFLVEGTESVVLTVEPPVCVAIFPPPPGCYQVGTPRTATAYIRDNDTVSNALPKVVITQPADGESFPEGKTITIESRVTDPDGYPTHLEVFANGRKIGETSVNFFQEPPPGQPFTFSIDWTDATPGLYSLVARGTDNMGGVGTSEPVRISVTGTNRPPTNQTPVVTITAIDSFASEAPTSAGINTATFLVRRSQPTNSELMVVYGIGGMASNGVDYTELSGFVTIPAGERSARIVVSPIDDKETEKPESVVLSLQIPPSPLASINVPPPYVIGYPGRAAAVIADNDAERPPTRCLSDGLFHAGFPGTNGFCYRLEISGDLANWRTVFTNVVTDGAIHFIDPETREFEHRFYRAVSEPNAPAE